MQVDVVNLAPLWWALGSAGLAGLFAGLALWRWPGRRRQ